MFFQNRKNKKRGDKMVPKNDLKIISELRKNARETLTRMSKTTSIPISTIYDRLRYHHTGLIKKHTALLDFNSLGFNAVANVAIKVKRDDREKIKEYLVKHHNVNSVYKINNNFDFMIEVIFRHIKELEDFLEGLDDKFKIKTKQTYYIIDDIMREAFLTNPDVLDMI